MRRTAPSRGLRHLRLPEQGRVPGWDEVVAIARPNYAKLFFDYTADPVAFGPLQTYFFYPDGRGWTDGQRRVLSWVARPGNALLDSSVRLDAAGLDTARSEHLMALKPLNSEGVLRQAKGPDRTSPAPEHGPRAWRRRRPRRCGS